MKCDFDETLMKSLQDAHIEIVADLCHSDQTVEISALYFVGTVIGRNLLHNLREIESIITVQQIVLNQFKVTKGKVHPIVDSLYSDILTTSSMDQVAALTNQLLQDDIIESDNDMDRMRSVAATAHCVFLMINVVKGRSQRDCVSKIAWSMLRLSLELLFPFSETKHECYEEWAIYVRTLQGLIHVLIGKTDLIALKGYEVSSILQAVGNFDKSHTECFPDSDIYVSACAITSHLLTSYPKQLYSCVPVLTCTLRRLLCHVMKSRHQSNYLMIQEFSKICALLPDHKDVFKKHIMYVVLFFINNMTLLHVEPTTKASLEPSIFLLLDTISEYEVQQLNTLMRPDAKASFQSLHKNYQKHLYKGQF
jgi:hypothetical protein